jgi:hypothetical protein
MYDFFLKTNSKINDKYLIITAINKKRPEKLPEINNIIVVHPSIGLSSPK